MLRHKLRSGTSKTKAGQSGLVRVALFWKSCVPACVILYHVTGSCKGPVGEDQLDMTGPLGLSKERFKSVATTFYLNKGEQGPEGYSCKLRIDVCREGC